MSTAGLRTGRSTPNGTTSKRDPATPTTADGRSSVAPSDPGPAPRFIRVREVVALTGLSRTTIWRMERRGDFPRSRHLTGQLVGWLSEEVFAWIRSRSPKSTGAVPSRA